MAQLCDNGCIVQTAIFKALIRMYLHEESRLFLIILCKVLQQYLIYGRIIFLKKITNVPYESIFAAFKNHRYFALAVVAQLIEYQPVNQKVSVSVPGQGTCLDCRPGP